MIIKKPASASFLKFFKPLSSRKYLTIAVLCLICFALGIYSHRSGFLHRVKVWLTYQGAYVKRYLKGEVSQDVEKITIDIKFKHYQKLCLKRKEALTNKYLNPSPQDYVPAKIRHNGKIVDVELRLKGDGSEHWFGDKWSFRIEVKGGDTLFGMKKFSIHHPNARYNAHEWIFKKALEREGLISLGYDFIEVEINGENKGIYAIEEYPKRELIERNRRREGVVVKFNDDLYFHEWATNPLNYIPMEITIRGFQASETDAIGMPQILRNPTLRKQFNCAVTLLSQFRSQKLKTSDVFDVDQLAKFYALSDLFGALHGATWGNIRFYYNPITSKLEPLAYDNMPGEEIEFLQCNWPAFYWGVYHYNGDRATYLNLLFSDDAFFEAYLSHLDRIAQKTYLEGFLAEIDLELKKKLHIIYRDYPLSTYSADAYWRNLAYIQKFLGPVKGFHAYFDEFTGKCLKLRLGNVQTLPVKILNVSIGKSILSPPKDILLRPWRLDAPVDYQQYAFYSQDEISWTNSSISEIRVHYRILGTSKERNESVRSWSILNEKAIDNIARQKPNAHTFDFITIDKSSGNVLIKPGRWTIDRNLIIPEGYKVVCLEGTNLNLANSAKILSYSALRFAGTIDAPITISSEDGTGQGIAVLSAGDKSCMEHVTFDNLSLPKETGWELTGAVTFYKTPVDILRCRFLENRTEDALNIISSEFDISETLFANNLSDAIDVDFGHGEIRNCTFVKNGGDAMDFSGSVVRVKHAYASDTGDKGMSVGENSRIDAHNIQIEKAFIGIASKDLSELTMKDVKIKDCNIGFAVYQKKPEFGPAKIKAEDLSQENVKTPYLVEHLSVMVVDKHTEIATENFSVYNHLYGGK